MKPWIESPICKLREKNGYNFCVFCRLHKAWQDKWEGQGFQNPRDATCPEGWKVGEKPDKFVKVQQAMVAMHEPSKSGPGDMLAVAIKQLTGIAPCSRCRARQHQMNRWGWWGCWRNRSTIAEWLLQEARARGIATTEDGIMRLLLKTFKSAASHRKAMP